MILFLVLLALLAAAAITWTVVELRRDGYRRLPTRGAAPRVPAEWR